MQMEYNRFYEKMRPFERGDSMKIRRIGAPVKEGCDLPGAELAIHALQNEGLIFDSVIAVVPHEETEGEILHLNTVTDFLTRLKQEVKSTHEADEFPLVFGGDHSLAIASIGGGDNTGRGILWIDAHGDCNTHRSSTSKRIHGMPLAVAQGHGHPRLLEFTQANTVASSRILLIGIRSLDDAEEILMNEWGLKWITQTEIDANGFDWAYDEVKTFLSKLTKLHVSFDCDSLDPILCPGVSTPASNGLTQRQALDLVSLAFDTTTVTSMDIVELNPTHDNGKTIELVLAMDQLVRLKK
jgi:arginase